MKTTERNGRLCNQIIRNIAFSFIAKRFDYYVEYSNDELIKKLGIELYSGKNKYNESIILDDHNYFKYLLEETKINKYLNPNIHYFQTEKITDYIYTYLNSEEIKTKIISKNPYNSRYRNNKDIFIHIRLGDASHLNPGINYYLNCINKLDYDRIFIASDSINSTIVKNIRNINPKKNHIIKYDEINTIQFGSTCKYIILSHGSFSALIGYLGFYSEIFYPNKNIEWCNIGMFTNKGWNPLDY
jgi:hypothetical protein